MQMVEGGIEAETRQMMENIKLVLEANGSSLKNLIRCTVMLADMGEWQKFNAVYTSYFSKPYPARSAFGVIELALGGVVEMECTGLLDVNS